MDKTLKVPSSDTPTGGKRSSTSESDDGDGRKASGVDKKTKKQRKVKPESPPGKIKLDKDSKALEAAALLGTIDEEMHEDKPRVISSSAIDDSKKRKLMPLAPRPSLVPCSEEALQLVSTFCGGVSARPQDQTRQEEMKELHHKLKLLKRQRIDLESPTTSDEEEADAQEDIAELFSAMRINKSAANQSSSGMTAGQQVEAMFLQSPTLESPTGGDDDSFQVENNKKKENGKHKLVAAAGAGDTDKNGKEGSAGAIPAEGVSTLL